MPDEPTCAAAPFDHAKADVILRSSDNIDFRVFKLFLSLASPFFETLFDIPQPANEDQEVKDGLVVIPVTENSKTLDILLRFCYPCTLADDPKLEELSDAMDILEAARKYSLDAIEKKALQAFLNPQILEAAPHRCFAIVHQGRLREGTLLAAKYTLAQPLIPWLFQGLELITASDLLSLLTYHKKCGDAVYALRLDLSWIDSHYEGSGTCSWLSGCSQVSSGQQPRQNRHKDRINNNHCRCAQIPLSRYKVLVFNNQQPAWWDSFMEETFAALRDKPCKKTIQASTEKTVQAVQALKCPRCSPKVVEGMRDFSEMFARKVEETISKIDLELPF